MENRSFSKEQNQEELPSVTLLTLINSIQGDQGFGACIIKLKGEIYTPVPEQRL